MVRWVIEDLFKKIDLYHRSPTKEEFVLFFGVSFGILALLTAGDIEIFDNYPRPIMVECYFEEDLKKIPFYDMEIEKVPIENMTSYMEIQNRKYFCNFWDITISNSTITDIENAKKQNEDDKKEIGTPHWDIQQANFLAIASFMGLIRSVTSYLWQKVEKKSVFHWPKVIMGIIWFVGTLIWFYFGFLDIGYYVVSDVPMEEPLDHLNDLGIFVWTKGWTGSSDVESLDLYLTAALGFGLFVAIWPIVYWVIKWQRNIEKNQENKK